jgi:N-methylhydantoinase A
VPVADGPLDPRRLAELEEAFGQEHVRTYGHRAGPEEPVELTVIWLIVRGIPERPLNPGTLDLGSFPAAEPVPARRAYFGPETGWLDTARAAPPDLGTPREGPCIIEEYDVTCVVAPAAWARLDPSGNIAVAFLSGGRGPKRGAHLRTPRAVSSFPCVAGGWVALTVKAGKPILQNLGRVAHHRSP